MDCFLGLGIYCTEILTGMDMTTSDVLYLLCSSYSNSYSSFIATDLNGSLQVLQNKLHPFFLQVYQATSEAYRKAQNPLLWNLNIHY